LRRARLQSVFRLRGVIDDHDAQWRTKYSAETARADAAEARAVELAQRLNELLRVLNATQLMDQFDRAFSVLARRA
jgi:hypothetical protein